MVLLVVNVLLILVHSNNSQNNCSIHLLALRVHNIWCLFSTRVSAPLLPLSPISAFITTILHCLLLPVKFILYQLLLLPVKFILHQLLLLPVKFILQALATTSVIHPASALLLPVKFILHQLLLLPVNFILHQLLLLPVKFILHQLLLLPVKFILHQLCYCQ